MDRLQLKLLPEDLSHQRILGDMLNTIDEPVCMTFQHERDLIEFLSYKLGVKDTILSYGPAYIDKSFYEMVDL